MNQPRHADIELAILVPKNRELALEQNQKNKRPHCNVEIQQANEKVYLCRFLSKASINETSPSKLNDAKNFARLAEFIL